MQLVDHRLLPTVPWPGVRGEVETIPFTDNPLEAAMAVGGHAGGGFAPVGRPAGDGTSTGVHQHFRGPEAMSSRCERPEDPVAVAAARLQSLHLHVPVVAGAVVAVVQINQLFRAARFTGGENQQFHPVRTWSSHREIDTIGGDAAAKRPGSASPDRAQRSTPRRQVMPSK